jgi:ribosomal protein S8
MGTSIDYFFVVLKRSVNNNKPVFKIKKTKYILQLIKILIKYKFLIGIKFFTKNFLLVYTQVDLIKIKSLITSFNRISTSTKKVYIKSKNLKMCDAIFVLSTTKGILTQKEAQIQGVGGKLLFRIF